MCLKQHMEIYQRQKTDNIKSIVYEGLYIYIYINVIYDKKWEFLYI